MTCSHVSFPSVLQKEDALFLLQASNTVLGIKAKQHFVRKSLNKCCKHELTPSMRALMVVEKEEEGGIRRRFGIMVHDCSTARDDWCTPDREHVYL